ncbi:MAG: glycerate kinase [Chloroflexota bacterium]
MGRPLTVVFAPDSFKGSLSSLEVAEALGRGWARARPGDRLRLSPLADGGEGTLVAIHAAGGWEWREAAAHDPLGRPLTARWLLAADGRGARAVVELAEASGLSRLRGLERDAGRASTRGTGEVLAAVLDAGVRHVVLGVGGSATTDGGSGILAALGARLLDAGGHELPDGGAALAQLARIDLSGLDPRLAELELRIACDVTNPLLGPAGAAATYGPQKGADAAAVAALDAALARYADLLEATTGRRERDTPGAGAAGGTTFGLLCLRDRLASLELVAGVELVMEETDLDGRLRSADLVVTGEGRIDAQTAFGKTALGVARRAAAAGIACVAVGGGVEPEGITALAEFEAVVVPVAEGPATVEQAMAAGAAPVERVAERVARLLTIGLTLSGARGPSRRSA